MKKKEFIVTERDKMEMEKFRKEMREWKIRFCEKRQSI